MPETQGSLSIRRLLKPRFPCHSFHDSQARLENSPRLVSHEEMLISLWILPSCHQGGFWGSLVLDPVKMINCQGKKQAKKTSVSLWFLSKLDACTETAAVECYGSVCEFMGRPVRLQMCSAPPLLLILSKLLCLFCFSFPLFKVKIIILLLHRASIRNMWVNVHRYM